MKVFDHLLLRIAALPYEAVTLSKTDLTNAYTALSFAQQELVTYKDMVSALLLQFNQTVNDPKSQQLIQNVRKKIFQLKPLKELESSFFTTLPGTIQHIPQEYSDKLLHIEALKKLFCTTYGQLLEREKENIQALSHHETFLKGISLSSHILYKDILKYQSKNIQAFKSDDSHTEKTVLKYLSRIVSKTTPFSAFTNIGTASLKEMNGDLYTVQDNGHATIKPSFTISAVLVNQIRNKVFSLPGIKQHLPVRLNKTLQKKRAHWTFVTYSNNGNHDFKNIRNNAAVNTVIQTLSGHPGLSMNLISKQLTTVFDEPASSILQYLYTLLDTGIFELWLDINLSNKDWVDILERELQQIIKNAAAENADIHFKELLHILSLIKRVMAGFPTFSGPQRITALQQLQREVDTFLSIDLEHTPEKKYPFTEKLIYEDTSITCGLALNTGYINTLSAKIRQLFASLAVLEQRRFSQRKAYHYFCSRYPKRGAVPFLDFYEQYFKDILQPETMGTQESKQAHFLSFPHIYEKLKEEAAFVNQWKSLLTERLVVDIHADAIHISQAVIDDINRQLEIVPDQTTGALGAFIQPVFSAGASHPITVVNAMYGSYGKMFSRFLGILPENVTTDLRDRIYEDLAPQGHAVEITDPSLHNANIYPNILQEELKLPGGRFSHPEAQQLQLSGLVVKRSAKEKCLFIIDKQTRKRILPLDFGFQAMDYRIELFQFFSLFSPVSALSHAVLLDTINTLIKEAAAKEALPLIVRPRIVFEQDIVLQRKTWIIPPAYLPVRDAGSDNSAYFEKIQSWKIKLQLPDQVFVRRRRSDLAVRTDDYKPQFIDLQSPLHITLLEKVILKSDKIDLIIEEALPAPGDTLVIGEAHFTTEFFVQISS